MDRKTFFDKILCRGILVTLFLALLLLTSCDKADIKLTPTPVSEDPDFDEEACLHEVDEGEYVEPADCITHGYTIYRCTICGEELSRLYDGLYGEHRTATRTVAGDCTHRDRTETYCTLCNYVLTSVEGTGYGEHKFKTVNETYQKKTCQTPEAKIVARCTVCGEVKIKENAGLAPHSYGKGVYTVATCLKGDYTTFTCSVCGDTKIEWGNNGQTGHDYEVTYTAGKDCMHLGTKTSVCKICEDTKVEEGGSYGVHKYTAQNATAHVCSVCGQNAGGHTFVYSVSATQHVYACSVCQYVQSSASHVFSSETITKQPTCTQEGTLKKTCVCGYGKTQTIAPTGNIADGKYVHTWTGDGSSSVTVPASCTQTGYTKKVCGCGYSETTTLPLQPHDFQEIVLTGNTNILSSATCQQKAVYKKACSVCKTLSTETFETGELASHKYYAYSTGDHYHSVKCSVCNSLQTKDAEHTFVYTDYENGYSHQKFCSACDYSAVQTHTAQCVCGGESIQGQQKWDVSASQNEKIFAYFNSSTGALTVTGTGNMKDYSTLSPAPYASMASSIRSITLQGKITAVGEYAFYNFTQTQTLTIGENVTQIGMYAFYNMTGLEKLFFNAKNCLNFSQNNFIFYRAGLQNGVSLFVGKKVVSVPDYFFLPTSDGMPSVREIIFDQDMGDTLSYVGKYAFYNACCEVYCPYETADDAKTLTVGDYAFYGMPRFSTFGKLSSAHLSVGSYAFYYNDSDTTAWQKVRNERYTADGLAGAFDEETTYYAFIDKTDDVNALIAQSRISEVYNHYYYFTSGHYQLLQSASDGEQEHYYLRRTLSPSLFVGTLTKVETYAFYRQKNLTQASFDCTQKSIYPYTFYKTGILSLSLPSVIESIGEYAFAHTADLTSVTLSGNVVIGKRAFENSGVQTFTFENVTEIGDGAFYGSSLLLADFSDNTAITSLSESVFAFCLSLQTVTLPEKVTIIPRKAFEGCSSLKTATLSDKTTAIGESAFLSCVRLQKITLPSTLTKIGQNAFRYCSSLLEIDNRSAFTLQAGSIEYGYVAHHAEYIYNGETGVTHLSQDGDFVWFLSPDSATYTLAEYTGSDAFVLEKVYSAKAVTAIGTYALDTVSILYFAGTEEEWAEIETTFTAVSFFSESEPTPSEKSYWHYDGGGNPISW